MPVLKEKRIVFQRLVADREIPHDGFGYGHTMTIRHSNGFSFEATLLSRTDHVLRIATQGSDDTLQLTRLKGVWVTEDCERVDVEFGSAQAFPTPHNEEDCICSEELVAKLIHLLFAPDCDPDAVPVWHVPLTTANDHVV